MILNHLNTMDKHESISLPAIKCRQKTGEERLSFFGSDAGCCLLDFWKWCGSNVLSNAVRGKFAEFIVGIAVGADLKSVRDEWGRYDVLGASGVRIEVKSAGYIQTWGQRKYSSVSFSIKPAVGWNAEMGMYEGKPMRHADVYVFCLLKNKDQDTLDPMKLEQWGFYVVPTCVLDGCCGSRASISLGALRKLTDEVGYGALNDAVEEAYSRQYNQ